MALTPISNTVEFVQDTVPTTATDGDSWLDTSLSPPRLKVFDDAVGGFIEPRSVQNLDVKVSDAGVNWASKTPKSDIVSVGTTFSISGSGYILSLTPDVISIERTSVNVDIDGAAVASGLLVADGNTTFNSDEKHAGGAAVSVIWRFNSSVSITETENVSDVRVNYVLD